MIQASVRVVGRELPVETETLGLDAMQDRPVHVRQDLQMWRETERCQEYLGRLRQWEDATGREVIPFLYG